MAATVTAKPGIRPAERPFPCRGFHRAALAGRDDPRIPCRSGAPAWRAHRGGVPETGDRWTYTEFASARWTGSPRACWRSASTRATASASGRRTGPNGCWRSSPPPASAPSSSTSIRPIARTELEYALNKVGVQGADRRAAVQGLRLHGDARRRSRPSLQACPPGHLAAKRVPQLKAVVQLGPNPRPGAFSFDEVMERGRSAGTLAPRRHHVEPQPERPDQHPVHLRHHRRAEGRDAHPPQHRQQRHLHGPRHEAAARRSAVHSRAALPLLRHGARQSSPPAPTA